MSDMAGKAARAAVERCGRSRDTMELMGSATWPVTPRGQRSSAAGAAEIQLVNLRVSYHVKTRGQESLRLSKSFS